MTNGMKRGAWLALLASLLPLGAAQAQRFGPPPPVVERHYAAPGPGYVWIPGYHRWDGRSYVWVGGRWDHPPRPRAYWVPGRWVPGPGGYRWVPGYWR